MKSQESINYFLEKGLTFCGNFQSKNASNLYNNLIECINFKSLFLTEKEYKRLVNDPSPTNPIPGRNIAEKMQLGNFFGDIGIREIFTTYVGERFRTLDYKFVVGVPRELMPDWIRELTRDMSNVNLGKFIIPEKRNCTFFSGIDFHQDIIDFPRRNPDFLTFYYYLSPVNNNDSPLIALADSHKLGADLYPHDLVLDKSDNIKFTLNSIDMKPYMLLGEAGDLFAWHPYTMHGTYPIDKGIPRISLRILIERNSAFPTDGLISRLNKNINNINPAIKTSDKERFSRKSILKTNKEYLIEFFNNNYVNLKNEVFFKI